MTYDNDRDRSLRSAERRLVLAPPGTSGASGAPMARWCKHDRHSGSASDPARGREEARALMSKRGTYRVAQLTLAAALLAGIAARPLRAADEPKAEAKPAIPGAPAQPSVNPPAPPHPTSGTPAATDKSAKLPPAAARPVDFGRDIKPLFEASCIQCHAKGKTKGGLSLETREAFLKGGKTGPAAVIGKSADSLIVHLVAGTDPENVMPMKGTKWTPEQVGLMRAWLDQGAAWDASITFARPEPLNLHPRPVPLPPGSEPHPIDRWMSAYFQSKSITPPSVVDDRAFARRAYLDVIGLLPTSAQLDAFLSDSAPDKRAKLAHKLLSDNANYADHWLTFWNDLLRNDYKGTGYIDGGRKQITGWLYASLIGNKPYDQFVRELINPSGDAEGFVKGIVWRGSVPPAMSPPMQAGQH